MYTSGEYKTFYQNLRVKVFNDKSRIIVHKGDLNTVLSPQEDKRSETQKEILRQERLSNLVLHLTELKNGWRETHLASRDLFHFLHVHQLWFRIDYLLMPDIPNQP